MRNLGGTALLAACATLVALLAAEALVRRFAPVEPPSVVLDERVIYRFAPHGRSRDARGRTRTEGPRLIQLNRFGYRGPEPDLAPERKRIAVYGDSFIDANFSDLPDTFAARLETELHARGHTQVQVLNAGTAGYGPDQLSLRIQDEIEAFAPSVVIVSVFAGNDFGDLMRNAIYRLKDGVLAENDHEIHQKVRKHFAEKEELFTGDSLLNHSMLGRALRRLWFDRKHRKEFEEVEVDRGRSPPWNAAQLRRQLRLREREYRKAVLEGDHRARLGIDSYDADMSLQPESDSARYKFALMEAVLGHIRDYLAARDVAMVLLVIPSVLDTCHDFPAFNSVDYPAYRRSGVSDALVGMAERLHIPSIDLFPEFSGPGCIDLYLSLPDNHWSHSGQAQAAQRMAEFLDTLPALAARP